MLKHLPASFKLGLADYAVNRYHVELPPGVSLADCLTPTFWAHHKHLPKHSIITAVGHNGAFDFDLRVVEVLSSGLVMKVRPFYGEKSAEAALSEAEQVSVSRTKTVPFAKDGKPVVRVEYLEGTKYRVRGLEGAEVARDLPSEAKANEVMAKYLRDAQLDMPSAEECAKALAEAEAIAAEKKAATAAKLAAKTKAA